MKANSDREDPVEKPQVPPESGFVKEPVTSEINNKTNSNKENTGSVESEQAVGGQLPLFGGRNNISSKLKLLP